jgi:hypothetical protein
VNGLISSLRSFQQRESESFTKQKLAALSKTANSPVILPRSTGLSNRACCHSGNPASGSGGRNIFLAPDEERCLIAEYDAGDD